MLEEMPPLLLAWYDRVKDQRGLPWRGEQDPYRIWVSEIMLQQTRAEAVKGYYGRFLAALPDVSALAECGDDELRKLWEGLGYYSRVRNLKRAAQVICREYAGVFPRNYADVLALPGIGEYTAGAVCSIAFDERTPAVDGNVLRLLSRLENDPTPVDLPESRAAARKKLAAVYPERAGDFTQALMELGATLCGPNRQPECGSCPLAELCRGRAEGTAGDLPARLPRKKRREEDLTLLILRCGEQTALLRRPEQGLLAGLWEYPNTPGHLDTAAALAWAEKLGLQVSELRRISEKKHDFTHIRWNMRGYYLDVREPGGQLTWLTDDELLASAALPTAFRQFREDTEEFRSAPKSGKKSEKPDR